MHRAFGVCFYSGLLLLPVQTLADTDIAGIKLPDNYVIDNQPLALNGAGIRSRFFVQVYVGALYLEQTTPNTATAIAADGPKSMQMVILYKEVEARKITQGWNDGFENNLGKTEFKQVAGRLKTFNGLFPALRQGDKVMMDYLPRKGTTLKINGRTLGHIEGDDFFRALLKVWLGVSPADKQLKSALLGN
jgi:hypothetical protein